MNYKYNSPYNAAVTGCGYMPDEMNSILPLLMSPEQEVLLKKEIIENRYLMMNTENTRKRAVAEFKRRYNSNVVLPRWNSIRREVTKNDIIMKFNEISANDDLVDSWSSQTKNKVAVTLY